MMSTQKRAGKVAGVTGASTSTAIHPQVRIGHVHLTVANLERALGFYRDALGFEITQRYGDSAVFLSAGGYHHHIALNVWAGEGAPPPPPGRTGLYHLAILYPSRQELARAFKRLFDHGIAIEGASDHGVSEAIYLRDPDGHGVELYADRAPERWPRVNGQLRMTTAPLNLDGLLAELHAVEAPPAIGGTDPQTPPRRPAAQTSAPLHRELHTTNHGPSDPLSTPPPNPRQTFPEPPSQTKPVSSDEHQNCYQRHTPEPTPMALRHQAV